MLPKFDLPFVDREFSSYSLLLAVAFGTGFLWYRARLLQRGITSAQTYAVGASLLLGAWAGAHLLPAAVDRLIGLSRGSAHGSLRAAFSGSSGTMFLGGFLGALLLVTVVSTAARLPLGTLLDAAAPPLALGAALGRLGCFAAGCCAGVPTSLPIGVRFPASDLRVHPTQLYSSAVDLAILFALLKHDSRGAPRGRLFLLFVILYSAKRMILETIRTEPKIFGPLTTAQVVAALLLAVSSILWRRIHRRAGLEPATS